MSFFESDVLVIIGRCGGDIFHLKEILGHSDIKTTMRYAHLSKTFLVDKADTVCFTVENVVRARFGKEAVNE